MSALRILHDIPGRLRLRVPAGVDPEPLVGGLRALPGVHTCRWTARTGSLLVVYDGGAAGVRDALLDAAGRAAGLDPPAIAAPPVPTSPTPARLASAVQQSFGELDASVLRATRGALDLRLTLPLALFGWAALQLARGRVGPLAWSSALWYAHGLFRDYSMPGRRD